MITPMEFRHLIQEVIQPRPSDSRGAIVFKDTFEEGIASYSTLTDGTLASVAQSSANYLYGSKSVKLVTGSDNTRLAALIKQFAWKTANGCHGIEFGFTMGTSNPSITIAKTLYGPQSQISYRVKYDKATGQLSYWDSTGAFVPFNPITPLAFIGGSTLLFHTIKLVVNICTGKYVRLVINGVEIDMSTFSGLTQPLIAPMYPNWGWQFTAIAGAGVNDTMYLSHIMFTELEP